MHNPTLDKRVLFLNQNRNGNGCGRTREQEQKRTLQIRKKEQKRVQIDKPTTRPKRAIKRVRCVSRIEPGT